MKYTTEEILQMSAVENCPNTTVLKPPLEKVTTKYQGNTYLPQAVEMLFIYS